jgi:hypothetical protein
MAGGAERQGLTLAAQPAAALINKKNIYKTKKSFVLA